MLGNVNVYYLDSPNICVLVRTCKLISVVDDTEKKVGVYYLFYGVIYFI